METVSLEKQITGGDTVTVAREELLKLLKKKGEMDRPSIIGMVERMYGKPKDKHHPRAFILGQATSEIIWKYAELLDCYNYLSKLQKKYEKDQENPSFVCLSAAINESIDYAMKELGWLVFHEFPIGFMIRHLTHDRSFYRITDEWNVEVVLPEVTWDNEISPSEKVISGMV